MNEGEAHCKYGCHFITPIDTSWYISFMRVALWALGIGYGLPWNGFAPSCNWMETCSRFHSPRVPSINYLALRKSESSNSLSDGVRCLQLSLTMVGRSAMAYLASRISTMHFVALRVLTGSWLKLVLSFKEALEIVFCCRLLIFLMGKRISAMVIFPLETQHHS